MSNLTDKEFKYLLSLEKELIDIGELDFSAWRRWVRELKSITTKDIFLVDYNRLNIEIKKITLQNRYRQSTVLIRYDHWWTHRNPDGTDWKLLEWPHVHIYKEWFDDKWAFPLSILDLTWEEVIEDILEKILEYINVKNIPTIKRSFF